MASDDLTREVERFFDSTAGVYDRAYSSHGAGGRILRGRAAAVIRLLGDVPGDVLDVGMGAGYLCAELDRRGWTVSGVDIADAMVSGAAERLPHRRGHLLKASAHALPFPDASFDAIVATGVLEYSVPDLEGALAELVRVLRSGGVAVVSFPNHRAPVTAWRGRVLYPLVRLGKRVVPVGRPAPLDIPRVSLARFRRLLGQAGLVIEASEPVGVRPLPAGVASRLEQGGSRLAFALAVQIVMRTRKVAA